MSKENVFIERLQDFVSNFFKGENVSIFLFGSRVRKDGGRYSDVDIGLIPKKGIDKKKITLLREAVEDLNIPYKVDIVDFSSVSMEFKEKALQEVEVWKD